MLADLKILLEEIGSYSNDHVTNYADYQETVKRDKEYWKKFDVLFQTWEQQCNAQEVSLEEVNETDAHLRSEIKRQQELGISGNGKKVTSVSLIWRFSWKLRELKYISEKHTVEKSECYCQLKADHLINNPNREFLEQIGEVWCYHLEDRHPLYQCKKCGHEWIISDPLYNGPSGKVVISWDFDRNGYRLVEDGN